MTRSASADLRSHLEGFVPSAVRFEKLAQDAIAYANGGHWTTTLEVNGEAAIPVATIIEQLQLGDWLSPAHDAWAPL